MRILLIFVIVFALFGCTDIDFGDDNDNNDGNPYVPPLERIYTIRDFEPDSLAIDVSVLPVFKMNNLSEISYSYSFYLSETNPPSTIDTLNFVDFTNYTPEFRVRNLKNNTTYYWEAVLESKTKIFTSTYRTGIQEFTTIDRDDSIPVVEITSPESNITEHHHVEFNVQITSEKEMELLQCIDDNNEIIYENYDVTENETFTIDLDYFPTGLNTFTVICYEVDGDFGTDSVTINNGTLSSYYTTVYNNTYHTMVFDFDFNQGFSLSPNCEFRVYFPQYCDQINYTYSMHGNNYNGLLFGEVINHSGTIYSSSIGETLRFESPDEYGLISIFTNTSNYSYFIFTGVPYSGNEHLKYKRKLHLASGNNEVYNLGYLKFSSFDYFQLECCMDSSYTPSKTLIRDSGLNNGSNHVKFELRETR